MNAELIRRIVASAIAGDEAQLLRHVEQLAASERKQGHRHVATELEALTRQSPCLRPQGGGGPQGPNSAPRSKLTGFPLVEVRTATRRTRDIVLAAQAGQQVARFFEEYSGQCLLARHGLTPKLKLLFCGPPGNGKTMCAEVMAAELGLPLLYVRLDALIASYLGETAANLRNVFEYAAAHLGVLFFDEFDALGKTRSDSSDVGELKRVVNSFLQLLDSYAGPSPLIAATNYEELLDHGIWRRFDDVVAFPRPSRGELERYFLSRLKPFDTNGITPSALAARFDGCSFADADRAVADALKTMVLGGRERLGLADFPEPEKRSGHQG